MAQISKRLILEKGDVINRCLLRVKTKMPQTKTELLSDIDAQDIITLNLERAIQACVDIAAHIIAYTPLGTAPTMADSFVLLARANIISDNLAIRLKKAVGLRNLLVHEYQSINWDIVWAVLQNHLSELADFVKEVSSRASAKD